MKKFLTVVLILIFVSMVFVPIQASGSNAAPVFTVGSDEQARRGGTVRVPIDISNNTGSGAGFAAVGLVVSFIPDHLRLERVDVNDEDFPYITLNNYVRSTVPGEQWISLLHDATRSNLVGDGTIVYLVFEVLANAPNPSGIHLHFTPEPASGRPANADANVLHGARVIGGQVRVLDAPNGGTDTLPPSADTTRLLHTNLHGGTGGPRFPRDIPRTEEWIIYPFTPIPTLANHVFAGWSLTPPTPGGTVTVVDRVPAATGTTAANTVVLHANWTMNFISVTDITVPATPIRPGDTITLVEQALPRNATNRTIIWDVINPGPTGATINTGNSYSFTAPREGTATIQATVINGVVVGGVLSNFTERFDIIVSADGSTGTTPPGTPGGGGTTPPPGTTAPPAGVTRPSGAGNLTVIEHFGTWTGSGTRTARVDADHNTFQRLWFGDNLVSTAHLTIGAGSTTITLGEAFIRNFSDGTYSFIAEFSGGHATLNLIVSRAFGNVPQTGVPDITLTTIIMGISLFLTLTVGVLLFFHLRAKRSNRYIGFDSGGVTIEKIRSNE